MNKFLRELLERAGKSAAQAAVLVLGANQVDAFHVDWKVAAGMSVGAFVLSALTSVASIPVGPADSPSLVK